MKKVFIIHGYQGSPNGAWRPWLMRELEKIDIYACALPMPNPDRPSRHYWIEEVKRAVEKNKSDDIYLVGHSLGATAILRFLEAFIGDNVKGVALISGPIEKTQNRNIDEFLEHPFDFEEIKNKADHFIVIHGDDDPNVPLEQGRKLSDALDAKLIVIKNGKHLNGSAGFFELPECLDELVKMVSKN